MDTRGPTRALGYIRRLVGAPAVEPADDAGLLERFRSMENSPSSPILPIHSSQGRRSCFATDLGGAPASR